MKEIETTKEKELYNSLHWRLDFYHILIKSNHFVSVTYASRNGLVWGSINREGSPDSLSSKNNVLKLISLFHNKGLCIKECSCNSKDDELSGRSFDEDYNILTIENEKSNIFVFVGEFLTLICRKNTKSKKRYTKEFLFNLGAEIDLAMYK